MTDITVGGSVRGDVAGGDITKTGNTNGGGGFDNRLVLLIIAVVLIVALAWGSREFHFSLWGIHGETK